MRVIIVNGREVLAGNRTKVFPELLPTYSKLNRAMGADRENRGTADRIISEVCNEWRNSDLRADNREIRNRLNAQFSLLEGEIEILKAELARRNNISATSPSQVPVFKGGNCK